MRIIFICVGLVLIYSTICLGAGNFDEAELFGGISRQSSDNTCGPAALATLINGLIDGQNVSEEDVLKEIAKTKAELDDGATLIELKSASIKLGHYAEWRKITFTELPKIKIPILILIGLNSDRPHFVVLKGIVDDEAYLADSIRGNIRMPYKELIEESLNEKYPDWFVMAINPSLKKPISSRIYLSDMHAERIGSHATIRQSDAITLTTLAKKNQILLSLDLMRSVTEAPKGETIQKIRNQNSTIDLRYGLTSDDELGFRFQRTHFDGHKQDDDYADEIEGDYEQGSMLFNHKMSIDDEGYNNAIIGVLLEYTGYDRSIGAVFNMLYYRNSEVAQFVLGGSIYKSMLSIRSSYESVIDYRYSCFMNINKYVFKDYLLSSTIGYEDGRNQSSENDFDGSVYLMTGVVKSIGKHLQVNPYIGYIMNYDNSYYYGFNVVYIGSW